MAEYIEFDKDHHAHHHKETFITKYIFSQDHKMIAKQYLFTGVFFMGIIGILMSALMRMQIAWPEEPNIFFDFLLGKWAPEGPGGPGRAQGAPGVPRRARGAFPRDPKAPGGRSPS